MSERQITPSSAQAAIAHAFDVGRPVFLWGPPGIGKSELVAGIAEERNAKLIDIRLSLWDPTDIKGLPYFNSTTHTMEWAPPVELPTKEDGEEYPCIVLLLDEMNSAAPAVQAAAYQLILNRRVGAYQLPDNVVLIAAGNRESDRGVTYKMPAPLANRFIHIEMKPDFDDWFKWAIKNQISNEVIGYLTCNKKDLFEFEPKTASRSFPTPRTWTFVSQLLNNNLGEKTLTDLVSGTIGEGLALKFMSHRKYSQGMPTPRDVLEGKVKKVTSAEISAMYSLLISLCYELKEAEIKESHKLWKGYVNNFFNFMMENCEVELVVMACRVSMEQYQLPFDPDEIDRFDVFHSKFGKYIMNS
jgi:hypothetical protein